HISPCLLCVLSHEQCDGASSLSKFHMELVMEFFKLWPYFSRALTLALWWYRHATREGVKDKTVMASQPFLEQRVSGFVFRVKRWMAKIGASLCCWAIKDDMQYLFWDASGSNSTS